MDLISKKELLSVTGISYGQLYRWKREKLIPEEWFIKQSSYTGQETFFPREQAVSRIRAILAAKDEYSLEQLAKIFSPEENPAAIPAQRLEEIQEIGRPFAQQAAAACQKETYRLFDLALLAAASDAAEKLKLTGEQTAGWIQKSISMASRIHSMNTICIVFTAGGEPHMALLPDTSAAEFDSGIQVAGIYPVGELANTIKLKYKNLFELGGYSHG